MIETFFQDRLPGFRDSTVFKIVEFSKNLDLCAMELSDECFNKQRSAAKPIYGLF